MPNRGLLALPEPVTGDLFFDIEGARYYSLTQLHETRPEAVGRLSS